ncbi:MAG: UDP-N-acetylmuramate dehydrogenase [Oscillospiraceae bacterium]
MERLEKLAENLWKLSRTEPALGGIVLLENEPMSRHTSFRIGGPVRLMAVVHAQSAGVGALLRLASDAGVTPLLMGNGTDLLAPDEGLDALVVKTVADSVTAAGETLTAESGALLSRVAGCGLEHSLSGLEFAHGIPGSVGGGVTMNAGAYGGELRDCITAVTWLDFGGALHQTPGCDCDFAYRHSAFSDGGRYIVSAQFRLRRDNPAEIKKRMEELSQKRREKQPLEYPSAGSTFKRPQGYFAAALIEQCGLKGKTVGGAQVSEKHAGFVINRGGATCKDVRTLMEQIRETVFRETGVTLEPEIKIL